MKNINLKTVCDSALKNELEKRGFLVQSASKTINSWKHPNKIIEFEDEYDYWYLGETKDFTEKEFENTIKEFLNIPPGDILEIYKDYFKLKLITPATTTLIKCRKEDKGAIEFWRI